MANKKPSEMLAVTTYELDAEGPADVAWVDVENYSWGIFSVMRSVGTGGLDALKILGNTAADGSGTDITIYDKSDDLTLSTVDAVSDTVYMEFSQKDLDDNPTVKGISVSLGHVTATDESVVTYVLGGPRHVTAALTSDSIA